ncbi:hypothetical protein SDC9_136736 [bioreactor metagenome]|uniref:Uncharacterized protein n=1 Tax=bioreactor metagenome TaxID=1076179 RepID=A0A645DJI9_9ZZZZ
MSFFCRYHYTFGFEFRQDILFFRPFGIRYQIGFIEYQQYVLVGKFGNNGFGKRFYFLHRSGQVNHPQHDARLFNFLKRALDSHRFNGIGSVADTGGIYKPERDPVDIHGVFNHIARGAVDIGNDGFLFVQQQVQQCGFPGIGFSDNGNGNTVFNHISQLK